MYTSEVEICNLALMVIGEPDITSLTENTKRARLCARYYGVTRDHILAEFDWPFARKTAALQALAEPVNVAPEPGLSAYALPSDCVTPLDLLPIGSRETWIVLGRELFCSAPELSALPVLRYTSLVTAPGLFSSAFGNIVSVGLAARICNPITGDKALGRDLYSQYRNERREAWTLDASVGTEQNPDDDPDQDTFVTGGDSIADDEGNQRY